jgi:3-methyladenine DNA glycosylase AlkD
VTLSLRTDLIERLASAGDPERARGQQAYMKSALPFHGVRVPEVRRIAKATATAHPLRHRDELESVVLDIWRRATHREQRYAATDIVYLPHHRKWLDGDALPMIEEMIVTGAWWDHVDELARHHMGTMLRQDPSRIRPVMWAWATDDLDRDGAMWRRRTSIVCQLGFEENTDLELLFHTIEGSIDSEEFFLRKAIGWALRHYARTDPDAVIGFVDRHADRLSDLSKREALKHLT